MRPVGVGFTSSAPTGVVGSAQTDITNPYEAIPCGCIYSFVCLAQRIEAEEGEGWTCLRCGEVTKECKPWNGDVLEVEEKETEESVESRPKPPRRKSVGFVDDESDGKEKTMEELDPMPLEDEDRGGPERDDTQTRVVAK